MPLESMHIAPVSEQAEPPAAHLMTPDQIRAADHLFAVQQNEQEFVSGLLSLYTGTILLRDLAAEHLDRKEEEKPKKLREDENPAE